MKQALILVDIQNDFVPGGALAVPDGDSVVPVANRAMKKFDLVIATQDWHPADHGSFASQHPGHKPGDIIILNDIEQVLWPDHCIQNSKGAEFVEGLETGQITKLFFKGTDKNIDSYSTFFDNAQQKSTGLDDYLKAMSIEEITVMGLATDYCVKFTALDSQRLGFKTRVIKEGIRGVEIQAGDSENAIKEMSGSGATFISIDDL